MHTLDQLQPGQQAEIISVGGGEKVAGRLQELGFIAGGRVETLYTAPWGDPVAYGVRGTVMALRRRDANQIGIRSFPAEPAADLCRKWE